MDYNQVLTTILLLLGAILIIILIVIGIKLMYTVDKTNIILTDVEKKLKSVDGVFATIDGVTQAVGTVRDVLLTRIIELFDSVFKKNKKEKENNEDE